jgi:nitrate reductase alpha subunit
MENGGLDESGKVVLPNGAIGFRWGPDGRADEGQWNLEAKEARHGNEVKLKLSVMEGQDPSNGRSASPTSAASSARTFRTMPPATPATMCWCAPCRCSAFRWARKARSAKRWWPPCSTCRWPTTAWRAACRRDGRQGLQRRHALHPAWQERITGTPREQLITVARQFADNADKTHGKSMVIIGAAMNHWYHMPT